MWLWQLNSLVGHILGPHRCWKIDQCLKDQRNCLQLWVGPTVHFFFAVSIGICPLKMFKRVATPGVRSMCTSRRFWLGWFTLGPLACRSEAWTPFQFVFPSMNVGSGKHTGPRPFIYIYNSYIYIYIIYIFFLCIYIYIYMPERSRFGPLPSWFTMIWLFGMVVMCSAWNDHRTKWAMFIHVL